MSQSLAILVSVAGLIATISQLTRPAILKRREKWLRETLDGETNANRRAFLEPGLANTTARIVSGLYVPGWRFLLLFPEALIGALPIVFFARDEPELPQAVIALLAGVIFVMNPFRRGIRLLAERYRVAYQYREGDEIQPVRVGMLNLMEGGTRREFVYAFFLAMGVIAISLGLAFAFLDILLLGLGVIAIGFVVLVVVALRVRTYVLERSPVYGPWSVEDHKM